MSEAPIDFKLLPNKTNDDKEPKVFKCIHCGDECFSQMIGVHAEEKHKILKEVIQIDRSQQRIIHPN